MPRFGTDVRGMYMLTNVGVNDVDDFGISVLPLGYSTEFLK